MEINPLLDILSMVGVLDSSPHSEYSRGSSRALEYNIIAFAGMAAHIGHGQLFRTEKVLFSVKIFSISRDIARYIVSPESD